MKTLLFNNAVFHVGRNVTVRRGVKWALENVAWLKLGAKELSIPLQAKVVRFIDIDAGDLLYEHDPGCRYYEGLLREMRSVYDMNFQPTEIVTVVSFNLTKEDLESA
jgi:hypothetical protein